MINKFKKTTSGFSMFIVMIVIAVLSIVVLSVSLLATKESIFATTNRESQYAISAADAGIECALYWDTKGSPTSSFATSTAGSITCNSEPNITTGSQNPIPGTTTISRVGGGTDTQPMSVFGFSLSSVANPSSSCVIVTVNKYYNGPDLVTHVYSRGYNNCNISDPRRVERGIEVQY